MDLPNDETITVSKTDGDIAVSTLIVIKLPLPFRTARPKYYSYPQGSQPWKDIKDIVTQSGSTVAGYVGLSPPYRDGKQTPQFQYRAATGTLDDGESNVVEENDDMRYGKHYEARGRCIFNAVMHPCLAKEYGFFQDAERPKGGMSPDGLTNAVRILCKLHGSDDAPRWIELGQTALEQKASRKQLYDTPKIPHIAQNQWQMHICGMHYGWLEYWSGDRVSVWLIQYSPDFIKWIERRLDLFDWHVANNIPITDSNPYFQWRRNVDKINGYKNSVADFLADWWFAPDWKEFKPTRPLRPPIPIGSWPEELSHLPSAPKRIDVGQLFAPPKPNMWLVYEQERVPERCRLDMHPLYGNHPAYPNERGNGDIYPPDIAEGDAWFQLWPKVMEWAAQDTPRDSKMANNIQRLDILAIEEMTQWEDTRPSEASTSLHFHAETNGAAIAAVTSVQPQPPSSLGTTFADRPSKQRAKKIAAARALNTQPIYSVRSLPQTTAAASSDCSSSTKRSLAQFLQDAGTKPLEKPPKLWDDELDGYVADVTPMNCSE